MGVFYIVMILLLRVIQNYFNKKSSTVFPETLNGQIKAMVLLFGCSSALALAVLLFDGGAVNFDWLTVGLASLSGFTLVVAQMCMLLAMQSGTMVIVSVFSTAGLIVPCVCGVLFFQEAMTIWQWAGVALFIVASSLLAVSAKGIYQNFSFKTVLLLMGAFLANGGTMLCQKTLTYVNPTGSVTLFSMLSFAIPSVVFVLYLLTTQKAIVQETPNRGIYLPMVFLAAAMFLINQIVTMATNVVPSAILFTLPNGCNNIIAAVMAAVMFQEKMTLRSIAGLALSIVSLVLVLNIF